MRKDLLHTICREKQPKDVRYSRFSGLTLMEVLIIIVIVAIFFMIFMPPIGMPPDRARRILCANHIHYLGIAMTMYGEENKYNVHLSPDLPEITFIYQDPNETLLKCMGIDIDYFKDKNGGKTPPQENLYCPANISQKKNVEKFWNYSDKYRATGYFWIIDTEKGRPSIKGSGEKQWIKKLDIKDASSAELIGDIVVSDEINYKRNNYPLGNFEKCPSKIIDYESTNHLINDKKPSGGNIAFVDGHVEWRPFAEMERRYGDKITYWW